MAQQSVPPHLFVIFGATGDLARRKLLPAVFRLSQQGLLDGNYRILGVARSAEMDDEKFRQFAHQALKEAGLDADEADGWCQDCLSYQAVGGDDDAYEGLKRRIEELERAAELSGHRLLYLALPPQAFAPTIDGLGEAGLHQSPGWTRLVVEKPFGRDMESARELNARVHRWFDESQVYRIDHFLGKETVQNLLVFRFANAIFESLWNRERVDNVQITVAEDIGVGGRGGYYDRSGALRDMVQNHLTQLLTLVAMEVPVAFEADAVRHEKIKVLRAIRRLADDDVVFAQYDAGKVTDQEVPGYREEEGIDDRSDTETYVALKLEIDNWRWQGVPFYLRSGKRLPRRLTQIAVNFRRPPVFLFESMNCSDVSHDTLLMTLQPDEGFALFFDVKRPGEPMRLEKLPLSFSYEQVFGSLPDAYVTLLLDVLTGDQTLFVHADEVEAAWRLYEPFLEGQRQVHRYASGSWGPAAADELLARAGHNWTTR